MVFQVLSKVLFIGRYNDPGVLALKDAGRFSVDLAIDPKDLELESEGVSPAAIGSYCSGLTHPARRSVQHRFGFAEDGIMIGIADPPGDMFRDEDKSIDLVAELGREI